MMHRRLMQDFCVGLSDLLSEHARAEELRAENEQLRNFLSEEGYTPCPKCGNYDTGTIPDANGDPAADYCKTCQHTW